MQKIWIEKNLLEKKLAEITKKDMRLIELCIVPPQKDGECAAPAFLHIGCTDLGESSYEDLESIDEFTAEVRLVKMTA